MRANMKNPTHRGDPLPSHLPEGCQNMPKHCAGTMGFASNRATLKQYGKDLSSESEPCSTRAAATLDCTPWPKGRSTLAYTMTSKWSSTSHVNSRSPRSWPGEEPRPMVSVSKTPSADLTFFRALRPPVQLSACCERHHSEGSTRCCSRICGSTVLGSVMRSETSPTAFFFAMSSTGSLAATSTTAVEFWFMAFEVWAFAHGLCVVSCDPAWLRESGN